MLQEMRGGTASVATFLDSDVEVDEFVIEPGSPGDGRGGERSAPPAVGASARIVRPDGLNEIVRTPDFVPATASSCSPGRPRSTTSARSCRVTPPPRRGGRSHR
ncbi:MAG: hypothetical protein R2705_21860 [Ilumatobacteraceae bacterium]